MFMFTFQPPSGVSQHCNKVSRSALYLTLTKKYPPHRITVLIHTGANAHPPTPEAGKNPTRSLRWQISPMDYRRKGSVYSVWKPIYIQPPGRLWVRSLNLCFLFLHLGKGLAGEPLSVTESEVVLYVSEFNWNTTEINNMTFSMSVWRENDTVELRKEGGQN